MRRLVLILIPIALGVATTRSAEAACPPPPAACACSQLDNAVFLQVGDTQVNLLKRLGRALREHEGLERLRNLFEDQRDDRIRRGTSMIG